MKIDEGKHCSWLVLSGRNVEVRAGQMAHWNSSKWWNPRPPFQLIVEMAKQRWHSARDITSGKILKKDSLRFAWSLVDACCLLTTVCSFVLVPLVFSVISAVGVFASTMLAGACGVFKSEGEHQFYVNTDACSLALVSDAATALPGRASLTWQRGL